MEHVISIMCEAGLSESVAKLISEFINISKNAFGTNLRSIVLFGSAAEKKLRKNSDINLLYILSDFKKTEIDHIREQYRKAHAAAKVTIMFVLESELSATAENFPVKFSDILKRHIVIYGEDLLSTLVIPPEAKKRQLKQTLLNLKIRLRTRYALTSLNREQLAFIIAESAAPLRAAAFTMCELQGREASSPKEAFNIIIAEINEPSFTKLSEIISRSREKGVLAASEAEEAFFSIFALIERLMKMAE